MTSTATAIILGGVAPAILLGVANVFQKVSVKAGIGTGPYLVGVGLTTVLVGALFTAFEKDTTVNLRSAAFTLMYGAFWALAVGCIAIALRKYNAQISQLVPLYNMNTLLSVLIGLIVMSEWQHVNGSKLLAASVLIIAGGILAANS